MGKARGFPYKGSFKALRDLLLLLLLRSPYKALRAPYKGSVALRVHR